VQIYRQIALFVALGAVSTPATAREWPDAGGWSIAETDENDGCLMASDFEGEGDTKLVVSLGIDGRVYVIANNYNWSATPGALYEFQYVVNGSRYSGGKAVGFESGLRKGFGTKMSAEFLDDFARGSSLRIYKEDGGLVDDLNLDGSGAGVAQLRRCVAHVKAVAAAEAREKARIAHIPRDPFADASSSANAGRAVEATQPAQPRANLASLITADDYPASALRAGEHGTVEIKVEVGPNGRVTNCSVTKSSGSTTLDTSTCRLIRSRARYTPARDEQGHPVASSAVGSIRWSLPPDSG
jgi:TonB family protein